MRMEDLLIKNIENAIRGIRLGVKTPEEAKAGIHLNKLKPINEGMYQDYLKKYINVVNDYKRKNNL